MNYGEQSVNSLPKSTEMDGFNSAFLSQLERLSQNHARLVVLGNRLKEDGQSPQNQNKAQSIPRQSGILSLLQESIDGFGELNSAIEQQLSKLESII